jgi:hypothetical protein
MPKKPPLKKGQWVMHKVDGRKGCITWDLPVKADPESGRKRGVEYGVKFSDRTHGKIQPQGRKDWNEIPPQEFPKRTFDKPVELTDVQKVFPADALNYMPEEDEIPREYWDHSGEATEESQPWIEFAVSYCVGMIQHKDIFLGTKQGIDPKTAFGQIRAIAGSYAPSHHHKEAAVAWLLSRWFTGVEWKKTVPEGIKTLLAGIVPPPS